MKRRRILDLNRYGFELFDAPIKSGRFIARDCAVRETTFVRKRIIVFEWIWMRHSCRLVANTWLMVTQNQYHGVDYTRYA
jgi:hypothetical protein